MHASTKPFLAIALFSLPTVMFGGFSLLRLMIRQRLDEFRIAYFRAGHAHAGVLLVLSLVVLDLLDRLGAATGWTAFTGVLLIVGVLAQSGGMFVHMAVGAPGRWSIGNTVSTVGGVLLAVALVTAGFAILAT